jgi:transcriptional regulator with XRE-family HTH domain
MTNLALKINLLNSGLKQFFIASRAGIEQTRFSKIVHGHIVATPEEKAAIADALGKQVDEIFPDAEDSTTCVHRAAENRIGEQAENRWGRGR